MYKHQPPLEETRSSLPSNQAVVTNQSSLDPNGNPSRHPQHAEVRAEPKPSHTKTPTVPLTIDQLTEFVSTMIYLLWHVRRSSIMALHSASSQQDGALTPCLSVNHGDAVSMLKGSNTAFRKFCQQVLSVTHLSESVVILSLKYIAKLLQKSPHIQGAEGSEYRLFIVALLLANKFHDDNTYTNKTWSDVSGMKLHELDIMELEFLDVLDFRLFVGEAEFDSWRIGLLTFMAQLQNATLMNKQHEQQQLIDTTLRSIGLSLPTTPDRTWNSPTNNILTQQQYLHLLNTTGQPEFKEQSFTTPLTRVPLRIPPPYPVYNMSSSSGTQPITIPTSSTPSALVSSLSSSLTPIDAMYHQPPPSQLYQQNYTNAHSVTEPSFYRPHHPPETSLSSSLSSSAQHPPLTYPAPVRTSNRSLPRNSSYSSESNLIHNTHPYYNSGQQQQQTGYKQEEPLVDYYAWKSNNKTPNNASRIRSQSNASQSKPCGPQQSQQQQQHPHDFTYQQIGDDPSQPDQHQPYP